MKISFLLTVQRPALLPNTVAYRFQDVVKCSVCGEMWLRCDKNIMVKQYTTAPTYTLQIDLP